MRTLFLAAVFLSFSCNQIYTYHVSGNGKVHTEQRNMNDFTGIEVAGPYDVYLEQATNYSVKIEGDENLLRYMETRKSGDILKISTKKGYNIKPKANIKIYVTAPQLNKLGISGSGSIRSDSKITNSSIIDIQIGGSGNVELDVDAPQIKAGIGGSGSVTLRGRTRNFDAEVAGSGEVHSFDLLSENTSVEIAGSGDAEVFASKTLDIAIAGAGDVRYKGTPTIKQSIAGSGVIRQMK